MNSEMCMNYKKLKLIKESLGKTDFELKDLEEWFDDNISPHDASVLRRLYGLDGDMMQYLDAMYKEQVKQNNEK